MLGNTFMSALSLQSVLRMSVGQAHHSHAAVAFSHVSITFGFQAVQSIITMLTPEMTSKPFLKFSLTERKTEISENKQD